MNLEVERMKIKALVSFAGVVTMGVDEEREVSNEVAKDLINAGYAIEVKAVKKAVKSDETK